MNKVSILIITKNRPNFLLRQLNYYLSVNNQHPIYIGDSSDKKFTTKYYIEYKKLKKNLIIKYFYLPELNDRMAMSYILERSTENYCAYSGDDDFQV